MTQNTTQTKALIEVAALLTQTQPAFKVGDLVVWKSKPLATKSSPEVGQPAVVTEVLDHPLRSHDSNLIDGPYMMEPLDIRLGVFSDDGDLIDYPHDSRRFRLATPEEINAWDNSLIQAARLY